MRMRRDEILRSRLPLRLNNARNGAKSGGRALPGVGEIS